MTFCKNKSRATTIEYGVIAAGLIGAIIVVMRALAQI